MTISTRWHKPGCNRPKVVIDGNVPQCRSCGSNVSWLLRKAAEEPAPSYSGIKLPEQAPLGQMDLWWPLCVPYTRASDDAPRAQGVGSSRDAAGLAAQVSDSSLSEIYTSSLGKDHFRLLYLSGSRTIDSPIHGDLVEYERDNCPEYETTSYTWGGEDGDATPCKPAYFGEFWDVLFLTRNCWSLLQYLRPQIGTRLVWVDSICINQNNIQERGAQVSSMPHIYRSCMRVVIYPGDHLVRKEEHRFRQKIRHDDLIRDDDIDSVDDSGIDIWGSVLQSRYISRVWIIQELILAPHAILALKNHDLYLSNNLLHRVSQKDKRRNWLEFMGQGYKLRRTTLYEGLKMTIDSQATDPRDRIFGILGILGANPAYSEIVPDYALSMRDCVIGAMGLILINSREIWPLLHARTCDTTSSSPSWVPSLDEIARWTDEEALSRLVSNEFPTGSGRDESIKNVIGGWTTAIHVERFQEDVRAPIPHSDIKSRFCLTGSEMPWYQNATIDSSCGALTLQLVRVFDKPHRIVERIDKRGDIHLVVEGLSDAAWFFTTKLPQKPERPCHMFMAFRGQSPDQFVRQNWWPLRLRPSDMYLMFAAEAETPGMFSLLNCFRLDHAMFWSASLVPPTPPEAFHHVHSPRLGWTDSMMSLFDILYQTLNYNTRKHVLTDQGKKSTIRYRHQEPLGVSEAMLFEMIVPGQGATASGFLQLSLYAARVDSRASRNTEEFRRAYAACLQSASAEFNPVVDDDYVHFTLVDNASLCRYWDSLTKYFSDIAFDSGSRSEELPKGIYDVDFEPDTYSFEAVGVHKEKMQWQPWRMLFPGWFDLLIPKIGETQFDGRLGVCTDHPPRKVGKDAPLRCKLHQDYEPQGHMGLHYWLPCAEEPRELRMPVRVRMPLRHVAEAIRNTGLHWYYTYLFEFSKKVSEDVDALLKRGPRPEDSNIYLHEWPKSLVDDLGFVWRNESVTFM